MVKVLELFGEPFSDGGQEAFIINILQAIDTTGLSIDVFTPYYCDNEYNKKIVESKSGKVTCCNLPFTPGKSRENIKPVIRDYLKLHQYDVVHIHTGSVSVLAIAAQEAKRCGVKKVIAHAHTGSAHKNMKHELVKLAYLPRIAKNADCFCACSKQAAHWQFSDKIADNNTVIVRNGINVEKYLFSFEKRESMREQLNIRRDEYVIGNVGRFSDEKNHSFLLKVFCEIVKEYKDCRLMLIGAGDNYSAIEQEIKRQNMTDKIILTGSVNNVWDYLQAMDVFVVPSKYEGLSLASIEAEASGLPVVASNNVPSDIQLSEDVVFLSLDDDIKSWGECVMSFKNHKRLNQKELINQKGFNVNSTAEQVRNLYLDI